MLSFNLVTIFLLATLVMVRGQDYNLIVRNARIVDGTSAPYFIGDVAVKDGLIKAVGHIPKDITASQTIDAEGNYLSPGFIDCHTHDDVAVLVDTPMQFKVVQGVTTVITGNCGFSTFPEGHLPDVQTHLRSLLGDIASNNFHSDFNSLRGQIRSQGVGVNVASLVGHGPIRLSVMGYENRHANQSEVDQMCALLEKQLEMGAVGLSLGLVYPPSSFASMSELIALASVVKKYDRILVAHARSYEGGLLNSVEEFLEVLRQSKARGLLSHLQAAGTPYWNTSIPSALDKLEMARSEEGIDVSIDMYPYLAGSSTILQLLPPSAQSGGIDELLSSMENATYLDWLKNMTEGGNETGWESKVALIGYGNIAIGSVVNPDLKDLEGLFIPEGAEGMKVSEFDFLAYVVKEDKGMSNIVMHQQAQSDNYLVFASRLQMIGSDSIPRAGGGKPHPRGFGTFPRVIGKYAREDKVMSLEEAVRKSTSYPASRFGIQDRGLIKPGMKADLVLFSPDIEDKATYENPTEKPSGVLGVWVNGVRVVGEGGDLIGEEILPGHVVTAGDSHDEGTGFGTQLQNSILLIVSLLAGLLVANL